jgi:hypothetical protein
MTRRLFPPFSPLTVGLLHRTLSPLTRRPLGRCWQRVARITVLSVVGSMCSSACVTRRWQSYWAWNDPGFSAESRCSAVPESPSHLSVTIYDIPGYPLPGVTVRVSSSVEAKSDGWLTDEKGEVEIPVSVGHCRVDVELRGFRPAHYELEIPPGTQCSVSFELDLVGSDVATVV